jgi:hypothetical protein
MFQEFDEFMNQGARNGNSAAGYPFYLYIQCNFFFVESVEIHQFGHKILDVAVQVNFR